jgi:excisionase family DNA binding protein
MKKRRAKTSCDTEGPRLYTVEDAASLISVSPNTMRGLITQGAIQAVRFGPRLTRIAREAIDEFIKKHTQPTSREVTA